jgi:hypothetical protein
MNVLKKLISSLLLAITPIIAVGQTNLLTNGDFSTNDSTGWTVNNLLSPYFGNGVFEAYQNSGTGTLSQTITGVAGTYTVSGSFNISGSLLNTMSFKIGDSSTIQLVAISTNTWTSFTNTLVTTVANPTLIFYIGTVGGGGTPKLDNLSVVYVLLGPSASDTQSSLELSVSRLKSIYNLQSAALINGLSYDCQVFDKNSICLSTGGRYSVNSGAYGNTTSALLIGAYRLNKNLRIGAWVDQNLSVNTGTGVNLGNSKPLFGVFGAWAENPTGEGYEVKVSAGYGDKDLTVTRDVIGTSEAGVGNSRLNSQAISSVSSYGFRLNNQLLASPYIGIRYSKITSNGYTEASSDAVTAPLTYSRLSQENVALMAGLKLSAKLDAKTTLVASAGVEQNLKNRAGQYSATGVDDLTSIEFNSNPQKTRVTASVGAYYDIDKRQRVSVNGVYREETFNPTATTSVLATYTVGF